MKMVRLSILLIRVVVVLFCWWIFVAASHAQGTEETPVASTKSDIQQTVAIPVAEIASRAKAVEGRLREIEAELSAAQLEERIQQALPEIKTEIAARKKRLDAALSRHYRSRDIEELSAGWEDLNDRLTEQERRLSERTNQLDEWLREIQEQIEIWKSTQAALQSALIPDSLLSQITITFEALIATEHPLRELTINNLPCVLHPPTPYASG